MHLTVKVLLWISLMIIGSRADDRYVQDLSERFSVRPGLQYTEVSIDVDSADLSYTPTHPGRFCLQLAWKGFSVEGGICFATEDNSDSRVATRAFDVQFHQYYQHFVVDLYYQHYRGFCAEGKDSLHDQPNLQAYHVGTSSMYVFNGKQFSHRAAFELTQRQLLSAGTWLLGIGAHYTRFSGHSDTVISILDFTNWRAGINGGYAYNWVFTENWLLHGSLTLGLHGSNRRISDYFDDNFRLEETVLMRFATNRNGERWGYGMSIIIEAWFMHQGDLEISATTAKTDLFVVRHF